MPNSCPNPTPKPALVPNFDRIARAYRWMEYLTFGRLLEKCRFALLPGLAASRNALVLGDGDGRFLSRLLYQNPALHATAVDLSGEMLKLLQHRCNHLSKGRITLIQNDIRSFTPDTGTKYDLLVTHFFLDCLNEAEISALCTRLQPSLQADTLWLISEFAIPTNFLLRPLALSLISFMYTAFNWMTSLQAKYLPNYKSVLESHGWRCIQHHHFATGLLVSQLWLNKNVD